MKPVETPTPAAKPVQDVPIYRQCPVCFQGRGGKGKVYSTQGITRYYKCDQCAFTWTATVKVEVTKIEHRRVDLNKRDQ